MQNEPAELSKGVSKLDVMSGSTISGFITFTLLTYSKQLPSDSFILPYLSDQGISFVAAGGTILITLLFSILRVRVRLILHKREYTNKIKAINELLEFCNSQDEKDNLIKIKSDLIINAANKISEI